MERDEHDDSGGGYPEADPTEPGDSSGGEDRGDDSGAPSTSSPEEGDPGQATGNRGAGA